MVVPFVVHCIQGQVVAVHVCLPLGGAVSCWGSRGCIRPVVKVCHNERAALPMSMNWLCIARVCALRFAS